MNNKEILEEMKHYFGVNSVEAVAVKLGYKESTASTWRSKGITNSAITKYKLIRSNDRIHDKRGNYSVGDNSIGYVFEGDDTIKSGVITIDEEMPNAEDALDTHIARRASWTHSQNIKKQSKTKENFLNNSYVVSKLSLEASAGDGIESFQVEETGKILLDKGLFRNTVIQENLRIIQVKGDSMEPTIIDGSHIVIDLSQTESIDSVYSINIDGQIKVKRLQFNLDGTISICSDNSKYREQIYNPKESQIYFKILGKKILSIQ